MISKVVDTRLLRHVWIISWPTVVYSLMEAAVGLVDIYFAGLLGDEAMASIGLCRQLFLILMIGTIAITTGTLALVSQHYGAKRYDWASSITFHSIFLAVLAGVIFGLIGYVFADEGLMILGAKGKVLQYGTEYLRMLMTGVVFLLVNFAGNGVFRALGDAKTPLKIALFINILNVILSYMLVFGIGWLPAFGVMGIAMGTVFARGIGAVIALWIMRHPHRTVRLNIRTPIQKSHFQQILKIGLPSGISGFFRNGARILFFWIIANSMAGTTALAAAAVCFQIRMITIMPSLAFQVGVAALVGQSIGKNDYKKAEAYGWTSTKLCSFIMAVVSIILFIFPPFFIRFFTDTPEVIQLGTSCMRFMV
ncbi:MATE family efflux transporter, partial [bacterium]|nr:MATE family efflux transporter [bacterium]